MSDTESNCTEPDLANHSSLAKIKDWILLRERTTSSSNIDFSTPCSSSERTLEDAIQEICRVCSSEEDHLECSGSSLTAFEVVEKFLESIIDGSIAGIDHIDTLVSLYHVNFLSRLFDRRYRIFSLISKGNAYQRSVCAINAILAHLGTVACFIASNFTKSPPCESSKLPNSVKVWQMQNRLAAASQLPKGWDLIPDTIKSNSTSPAAKRLCIALLFGAVILANASSSPKSVTDEVFPSHHILTCLRAFLASISQSQFRHSNVNQINEAIYAMAVSLYVWADAKEQLRKSSQVIFHPHAIDGILYIIRHIFDTQTKEIYFSEGQVRLECSQKILVFWGSVVPWCWHSLDDGEVVVLLTSVWLYYHSRDIDYSVMRSSDDNISLILRQNSQDALRALRNQLHYLISVIKGSDATRKPSTVELEILGSTIYYLATLAEDNILPHERHLTDDIQKIFELLAYVGATTEQNQFHIIRYLCSLRPNNILEKKDLESSIIAKLLNVLISQILETVPSGLEAGTFCTEVKLSLQFSLNVLSILCCETTSEYLLLSSGASLYNIQDILLSRDIDQSKNYDLYEAFFVCLVSLETSTRYSKLGKGSTPNKSWKCPDIFNLYSYLHMAAPSSWLPTDEGHGILTKLTFASWIRLVADKIRNSLLYVEAWGYLRDTFFTCASFDLEFLNITPSFVRLVTCESLLHLAQHMDQSAVHFIRSSPLTVNLHQTLHSFVSCADTPSVSPINRRLSDICKKLVLKLSDFDSQDDQLDETWKKDLTFRIFCSHSIHGMRLALLPETSYGLMTQAV